MGGEIVEHCAARRDNAIGCGKPFGDLIAVIAPFGRCAFAMDRLPPR